jgi:hypothetical protein
MTEQQKLSSFLKEMIVYRLGRAAEARRWPVSLVDVVPPDGVIAANPNCPRPPPPGQPCPPSLTAVQKADLQQLLANDWAVGASAAVEALDTHKELTNFFTTRLTYRLWDIGATNRWRAAALTEYSANASYWSASYADIDDTNAKSPSPTSVIWSELIYSAITEWDAQAGTAAFRKVG